MQLFLGIIQVCQLCEVTIYSSATSVTLMLKLNSMLMLLSFLAAYRLYLSRLCKTLKPLVERVFLCNFPDRPDQSTGYS
jgi:hypothetical protein